MKAVGSERSAKYNLFWTLQQKNNLICTLICVNLSSVCVNITRASSATVVGADAAVVISDDNFSSGVCYKLMLVVVCA